MSLLFAGGGVAPAGVVYFKSWWLVLALGFMGLLSLWLTFNLLNNLRPGPYYNLFTLLVFVRLLLYFTLGVTSLLWYEGAVRKMRRQLTVAPPVPEFALPLAGVTVPRLAFASGLLLVVCIAGTAWAARVAVQAPYIEQIKFLLPAVPGQQFSVRLTGRGFDPNAVKVSVAGPGCPVQEPCIIPHSILQQYGDLSDSIIESVPLTLAAGDFQIFLENSDDAKSKPIKVAVPHSP